jgi:beta-N-acetylhexosaminidase
MHLSTWTTAQLVNQLIVVPLNAASVSTSSRAIKEGYGAILITSELGPSDLAAGIRSLRSLVPRHAGLLVMADDEGGGVWRLRNLVAPLPWAKGQAVKGPKAIESLARVAGRSLAAIGVNMDLAPVADLDASRTTPSATNADGLRSYGADPSVVAADVDAFVRGMSSAGEIVAVKHFPGLGGVSPNTDYGAASTKPWSLVQRSSLEPFVSAIGHGASAIMVASATIPGLSSVPASISPAVVRGVIRGQLGFRGLVVTDSLTSGAFFDAHIPLTSAVVRAVGAGDDLVLFSTPAGMTPLGVANQVSAALEAAVANGRLSRDTVLAAATRVLRAKGDTVC